MHLNKISYLLLDSKENIIFRWIPYVHVVKPKDLKIEVENIVKGYLENN